MLKPFRPKKYFRPTTIKETVSLLEMYEDKARLLAGGTDLFVNKPADTDYLIDISLLPLDYIRKDPNTLGINIGALTTLRSIEKSTLFGEMRYKVYSILAEAARNMASVAIRNMATVGGNICNAVPSADFPPGLIVLDAKANIIGPSGNKIVPLEEFFVYVRKTVLQKGELLTEIQIPEQPPFTGTAFLKLGRVHEDIALVNVATRVSLGSEKACKDARIVLGAVAPTPIRARKAENLLLGEKNEDAIIEKVGKEASKEAIPISDVRASAEYRREMCQVLVERAVKQALNRAMEV